MERASPISERPGWTELWSSRPLLRFIVRRIGALLLLLLGITLVAFVLTQLVPGDPALANLGQRAGFDPEAVEAFREHYGLDEPLPAQYGTYLWNLLHGDLGESQLTHRPVLDDLRTFFPATAELALFSIVIAVVVGVALGALAAMRRDRLTDQVLRVVTLGGVSMPTFWIALVALYVFFFELNWFPGGGRLAPAVAPPPDVTGLYTVDALIAGQWSTFVDALDHLVLPALVLAAFNVSLLTRFTRAAALDVVNDDYVRTARAKGMPERTVVVRHVLRAALPAVVTVIGLLFANVLTGAVLVENIFAWPGIGQYAYRSSIELDLPAIMGVSLLVAIVYTCINFVVDLTYGVLDPRIRLE